jgi:hypothetical protein
MFCDQCGAPLVAGQQRCGRCGKEILGRIEAVYVRRNRVQEHFRLLGILWIAYSALHVIVGVVLIVVANTIFAPWSRMSGGPPPEVTIWLRPLLDCIAGFILVKGAAGFFAGWGLLQREPWARILALIIGFISLFTNIPIGTAMGVYTLWVLLPAQSDDEYRALTASQAA